MELQATDLISGAIFQEIEHQNKDYTDILRRHIKLNGTIKKSKECYNTSLLVDPVHIGRRAPEGLLSEGFYM